MGKNIVSEQFYLIFMTFLKSFEFDIEYRSDV